MGLCFLSISAYMLESISWHGLWRKLHSSCHFLHPSFTSYFQQLTNNMKFIKLDLNSSSYKSLHSDLTPFNWGGKQIGVQIFFISELNKTSSHRGKNISYVFCRKGTKTWNNLANDLNVFLQFCSLECVFTKLRLKC